MAVKRNVTVALMFKCIKDYIYEFEHSRKVKIAVTIGIFVTTFLAVLGHYVSDAFGQVAHFTGLVTSIMWTWENF